MATEVSVHGVTKTNYSCLTSVMNLELVKPANFRLHGIKQKQIEENEVTCKGHVALFRTEH